MSEEQKLRKKCYDQTKAKRLVNIGETFQRWRDLREVKGMKTNAEVAKFLLDSYERQKSTFRPCSAGTSKSSPLHMSSPESRFLRESFSGLFSLFEVMDRISDVMRLCCEVSSDRQMKAAVRNSGKGAMVAGGSAFLGGLLLGPAGIAVGGAVGGLLGWGMTSGQFKPVHEILMELPPRQQRKLYKDVMAVLGSLDWTNALQLIAMVMGNASIQEQVIAAILTYVTNELHAEIRYGD